VPREVEGGEGVRWNFDRAYAGLAGNEAADEATRARKGGDRYRVSVRRAEERVASRWSCRQTRKGGVSDDELLRRVEREIRSGP